MLRILTLIFVLTFTFNVHAETLEDVLGAAPGSKVPLLIDDDHHLIQFKMPANVQFEIPVPEGFLSEYFQFITVTVLPPDLISSVTAKRAYLSENCLQDSAAIESYLLEFFPAKSERDQYGFTSLDQSTEMTISCSSSGPVPFITLELAIYNLELSNEFTYRMHESVLSGSNDSK